MNDFIKLTDLTDGSINYIRARDISKFGLDAINKVYVIIIHQDGASIVYVEETLEDVIDRIGRAYSQP